MTPTQGEHAQTEALRPKFGDLLRNTMASESNPRRDAYFIREVHRSGGGVNPGRWFEMTDGKGETWLSNPQNMVPAPTAQPAAPQGVAYAELAEMPPTDAQCLYCGASEGQHFIGRCGSVMGATRYTPAPSEPIPTAQAAPAAGAVAGPEDVQRARIIAAIAQRWIGDRTHLGALVYLDDLAWALKTLAAAPTPAAQADSVLEDAARLDWLQHKGATVEVTPGKPSYDWRFRVAGLHATTRNSIREAIDAARKQGGKHD